MVGRSLVTALEDDWRATLDAVARARGWPTSADVARLGERAAKLSAAYNAPADARGGRSVARGHELLSARLAFSFPRDVPKGAGAVRELVACGALAMKDGLRVLDIGAGMGATTFGAARALERAGARGVIDATWVDADGEAIAVGAAIAAARRDAVIVRATTVHGGVSRASGDGFDLVLMGQVLSELDAGDDEDARVAKHVALVRDAMTRLAAGGSLVIVEPALRDRTRHLHRVRDALLAGPDAPTLFAPCLHAAPCPALASEGDWCHEDLAVDLPAWLVPIARAAGLRYQGLTFSYLVLRRDAKTLSSIPARGARLRVVSDPLVSKGKREIFVCGELGRDGATVAGRARATRLDRDRSETNAVWQHARRGDLLAIAPAPDAVRARIEKDAVVTSIQPSGD